MPPPRTTGSGPPQHQGPERAEGRRREAGQEEQVAPAQQAVFLAREHEALAVDVAGQHRVDAAVVAREPVDQDLEALARELREVAEEEEVEHRRLVIDAGASMARGARG